MLVVLGGMFHDTVVVVVEVMGLGNVVSLVVHSVADIVTVGIEGIVVFVAEIEYFAL